MCVWIVTCMSYTRAAVQLCGQRLFGWLTHTNVDMYKHVQNVKCFSWKKLHSSHIYVNNKASAYPLANQLTGVYVHWRMRTGAICLNLLYRATFICKLFVCVFVVGVCKTFANICWEFMLSMGGRFMLMKYFDWITHKAYFFFSYDYY